jgi:predicted Zn-dependent protease
LRIEVITVQPGDTVESLSYRMSGLDQHAQVKPRDRVKIVVD